MTARKALLHLLMALGISTVATTLSAQQPAPPKAEPPPAPQPATPPAATNAPAENKASGDAMQGTAAYYSNRFNGRRTVSGARFNNSLLTAAHMTLPMGSRVKVTNLKNNHSVVVTINDRGPTNPGRIIDVSRAAAKRLGFVHAGLTEVKLEVVGKTAIKRSRHKKA